MKIIITIFIFFLLNSCADYKSVQSSKKSEKKYYSSTGFVLIYNDDHYLNKIITKKINNEKIIIIHNSLKRNTPIKIINPDNQKFIETKIYKRGDYPKIFNAVVSEEIARILKLNRENPYLEIIEIKKNKKFIAKKSTTFDEEKQVAEKAPVESIEVDILSDEEQDKEFKTANLKKYKLIVSDFYFLDSAQNLKNELINKIKVDTFYIKKINNNKYRLYAGPFENFNALKTIYISLNDLGFEGLDIYKE